MNSPRPPHRWLGPPLALQIMGLLIAGLVIAQVVTLLLTLLLPPEPRQETDMSVLARVLAGTAESPSGSASLQRVVQGSAPEMNGAGWLTSDRSRRDLARLLGLQDADVRLFFFTPLPFAGTARSAQANGAGEGAGDGDHETQVAALQQERWDRLVPSKIARTGAFLHVDYQVAQAGPPGGGGFQGPGGFPGAGGFGGPSTMARPGVPGVFGTLTPPAGTAGSQTGGIQFPQGMTAPDAGAERAAAGSAVGGSTAAPLTRSEQSSSGTAATSLGTDAAGRIQLGGPNDGGASGSLQSPQAASQLLTVPAAGNAAAGAATGLRAGAAAAALAPLLDLPAQALPATSVTPLAETATVVAPTVSRRPAPRSAPAAPAPAPTVVTAPAPVPAAVAVPETRAAVSVAPPPRETPRAEAPNLHVPAPARGLFGLAPPPFVEGDFVAAMHLPDGRWAVVQPTPESFPNAWQRRVLLWFAIAVLLVAPGALWFSRRLVRPLTGFARAAEQLGRDPTTAVLALDGPAELGRAAMAFNGMQSRLRSFVADRTAMMGAISHDLRTPLTRLRFRIEDAPEGQREGMLQDVDEMEQMISSVLDFIRDASEPHSRERLDLGSIVEDVVEDALFVGKPAVLGAVQQAPVDVDAIGMRRLIGNLVENAVKYGDRAHVRLFQDGPEAVTEVTDEGQGLPDDELERVFQPFYRTAQARRSGQSGTGLGLAVCRSIARAHGGDVLLKRGEQGLVAQLRLPLAYSEVA